MKYNTFLDYPEPEILETSELDIVYIDQQPALEFNRNEFGWPRNDISAFELAGSEQEAEVILARLQELPNINNYEGLTDEQLFDCVCPRRATSDPVLFAKFQEKLASLQYDLFKKKVDESKDKENEPKDKENSSGDSSVSTESSEPSE